MGVRSRVDISGGSLTFYYPNSKGFCLEFSEVQWQGHQGESKYIQEQP